MPRQKWYWDQYDLESQGGELDITNDDFLEQADLDRDTRAEYETRFIDELYGTDQAVWGYPDSDYAGQTREGTPEYAPGQAVMRSQSSGAADIRIGSYEGDTIDATWGLDLRRVLNEDLEVGTPDHYEWLTRGEVDWASYAEDNAYQKAFNSLKKDKDAWQTYGDPTSLDFLTSDSYSDAQKVSFIRDANDIGFSESEEDDKWHIPDDFDNKYTAKYHHDGPKKGQPIDPAAVQPYEAKPLFDPNSAAIQSKIVGADGKRLTINRNIRNPSIAGGPRDTGRAAARAGITIRPVNVQRPANIPASWGPVK